MADTPMPTLAELTPPPSPIAPGTTVEQQIAAFTPPAAGQVTPVAVEQQIAAAEAAGVPPPPAPSYADQVAAGTADGPAAPTADELAAQGQGSSLPPGDQAVVDWSLNPIQYPESPDPANFARPDEYDSPAAAAAAGAVSPAAAQSKVTQAKPNPTYAQQVAAGTAEGPAAPTAAELAAQKKPKGSTAWIWVAGSVVGTVAVGTIGWLLLRKKRPARRAR